MAKHDSSSDNAAPPHTCNMQKQQRLRQRTAKPGDRLPDGSWADGGERISTYRWACIKVWPNGAKCLRTEERDEM